MEMALYKIDSYFVFLCSAAADYLNCLEMRLQVLCKNETAAWQRKMTRFLLVQAFELTFCSSMLGKGKSIRFRTQGQSIYDRTQRGEVELADFCELSTGECGWNGNFNYGIHIRVLITLY